MTENDKMNCGHCQWQGGMKVWEIFCLIDDKRHKTSDSCEHWQDYDSSITKNDRIQLAISYKAELQAKKRDEEQRKLQEKRDEQDKQFQLDRDEADRSFQKKLFIWQFFAGLVSGVMIAIVGQILLKALNLIP